MINVKYSNGTKRVARIERGLEMVRRTTHATMPPTNDAVIPSPSALPGRPDWAIG